MTMLMAERVERPASLFGSPPEEAESVADMRWEERDPGGARLTLDDAIVDAWEGLAARRLAACPLCDGALRPRPTRDGVRGSCADCGTTLS